MSKAPCFCLVDKQNPNRQLAHKGADPRLETRSNPRGFRSIQLPQDFCTQMQLVEDIEGRLRFACSSDTSRTYVLKF